MTDDWTQGDGSAIDRAWLADWRRRVATLYSEVRGMAASDPDIALAHWRAVREQLYREHPQSPVPPDARAAFQAAHFEHDPSLRFEVVVEPAPPPAPGALAIELPNSGADALAFTRLGRIAIPFPQGSRSLSVFWMAGYAGGLFIPFRDMTNGHGDVPRRPVPGRWRQERRPRRRPGDWHAHRRLQLRLPALVRVRSALGLPAGPAGEPAGHARCAPANASPDPQRTRSPPYQWVHSHPDARWTARTG